MAFSEKLLAQGERVELELRTHVKTVAAPILVFIVTVAAVAYLLKLRADNEWASWLMWLIIVVGVLVFLVWVAIPLIKWRTTQYVVTNRRLLTRTGLITRTGRDIPLYRINDVTYEKGPLDRILGCGTLIVSDATEKAGMELHDVPSVEKVQVRLNELLFQTDDGSDDGEYPPTEPRRPRGQIPPTEPARPGTPYPPQDARPEPAPPAPPSSPGPDNIGRSTPPGQPDPGDQRY
ncbi:PH domain-containing protein [Demetria terragena]|uniref:PH domain-containing protein n=1 Tax=Demetria terragena TaxID=63959 RepID=UPI0003766684|nr:PH domain-containing protein [Demetria terragena]